MAVVAVVALVVIAAVVVSLAGEGSEPAVDIAQGSDPDTGEKLIERYGCGACHHISGIDQADGRVGPSLEDFAEKRTLAGVLPNTESALVRWITDPESISRGTLMPDLGVTPDEARDIGAYLYSH
jgi:cytochrome c